MNAVSDCQHNEMILNLEMIVRSDRVFEEVFKADSPKVLEWTQFFHERAKIDHIFGRTWEHLNTKKKMHAEVVGTFWHHFSSLAPQIMCIAASKVSNNLMRHYIVQIIYEELGSRNHRLIHPDLFLDCLADIGVSDSRRSDLVVRHLFKVSLGMLLKMMNEAQSDSELLGILLELEIDAEENIATILKALCFDEASEYSANKSSFFRIHKIAEAEHIRLDVANFLRFCPTEDDKREFIKGFDHAVFFWKMYWKGIADIIEAESRS
jgi:chlorite dismutase